MTSALLVFDLCHRWGVRSSDNDVAEGGFQPHQEALDSLPPFHRLALICKSAWTTSLASVCDGCIILWNMFGIDCFVVVVTTDSVRWRKELVHCYLFHQISVMASQLGNVDLHVTCTHEEQVRFLPRPQVPTFGGIRPRITSAYYTSFICCVP